MDLNKVKSRQYKCLIDPNSTWKSRFDLYIMFVMLFTALVIPWRLAFSDQDNTTWKVINATIDLSFLVDIILTFYTARFDEKKLVLVTNRKQIACDYISSWFFLDVISIFPFEFIFSKLDGNVGNLAKISRIGKLYKLIRIMRMIKMIRLFKDRKKIASNLDSLLKISAGMERLTFLLLFMAFFNHLVACLWVFVA